MRGIGRVALAKPASPLRSRRSGCAAQKPSKGDQAKGTFHNTTWATIVGCHLLFILSVLVNLLDWHHRSILIQATQQRQTAAQDWLAIITAGRDAYRRPAMRRAHVATRAAVTLRQLTTAACGTTITPLPDWPSPALFMAMTRNSNSLERVQPLMSDSIAWPRPTARLSRCARDAATDLGPQSGRKLVRRFAQIFSDWKGARAGSAASSPKSVSRKRVTVEWIVHGRTAFAAVK